MANSKLSAAKSGKNNEFYTRYEDIQREVNAYLDYNPDTFRDKTVLLPCDDPEWSNFTRFFAQNFETLGLKKLISTSYAANSKPADIPYQTTFFEEEAPQFDQLKTRSNGKIFTLTRAGAKKVDLDDLKWKYLEGDGDFRSDEVTALRDEADIIVTNPPFSLSREFIFWIMEADKNFLIIGNQNSITYKDVFPLIKSNRMWLGNGFKGNVGFFESPYEDKAVASDHREGLIRIPGVFWFTNLDHGRRHQPLQLMTMNDNIRYSKHKEVRGTGYQKYDNYDAIEVPFTDAIPDDYTDVMGVPITFLDKYCPAQFEIVGMLQSSDEEFAGIPILRTYDDFREMRQDMTYTGASGKKANGNPVLSGKSVKGNFLYNPTTGEYVHSAYARIVIRKKA